MWSAYFLSGDSSFHIKFNTNKGPSQILSKRYLYVDKENWMHSEYLIGGESLLKLLISIYNLIRISLSCHAKALFTRFVYCKWKVKRIPKSRWNSTVKSTPYSNITACRRKNSQILATIQSFLIHNLNNVIKARMLAI